MGPPRCNKLLVVNINSPSDSTYVDPRYLTVWLEGRRLGNHLFLSIGKKDFCRALEWDSEDPKEIQLQAIRELRADWRP